MRKIILFIAILLLGVLVLIGGSCGNDENGENGEEERAEESKGGSCNGIEEDSHCIDYTGSWWSESSCSQEGYFYSPEPCPQPTVGGCKQRPGTANEQIIWAYNYGGRPIVWKYEIDDVLRPSCVQHPHITGEWIPGTAELKD